MQNSNFIKKQYEQQIRYSNMCKNPQQFPIITSVKQINLPKRYQRRYSNMWWRRLGSSQSTPTVSGWPSIALTGSEIPY
jgi:hypothetical protein